MSAYRRLLPLCLLLAIAVIGLGAYVRLSDAGLGCPDWPGCYGQLLGGAEIAADPAKAAKEMAHRYLAGSLGLAIFALCLLSWRLRAQLSPVLPTVLAGLVVAQALLGMWTVTLLLKPLIVSAHLLGGMTTLTLLAWLQLRLLPMPPPAAVPAGVRHRARLALLVVVMQIALGGWVSSNYAALACAGFPTCGGAWLPAMDFAQAFELHRPLGQSASGILLTSAALTAIHWTHRVGAGVVLLIVGGLALRLWRLDAWRGWGGLLALILAAQIALGIGNVLLALPLPLAVAHNLGATLLLLAVVALNFRLSRRLGPNGRARPAARFNPLGGRLVR